MSITLINLEKTKYQKKKKGRGQKEPSNLRMVPAPCFCMFAQEVEVIYPNITLAELRITYGACEIHRGFSPGPQTFCVYRS